MVCLPRGFLEARLKNRKEKRNKKAVGVEEEDVGEEEDKEGRKGKQEDEESVTGVKDPVTGYCWLDSAWCRTWALFNGRVQQIILSSRREASTSFSRPV